MSAVPNSAASDDPWRARPLRIALVRQRYRADGGGERFVNAVLKALDAHPGGLEVSLLTRRWTGALPAGVRALCCDPPHWGRVHRERGFARAVRAVIAREGFDLVQSHERIPGCAVYRAGDGLHRSWLAERLARAPWPVRWWLRSSPFHRAMLARERALFADPRLRAVICNSAMVRDEIREQFGVPAERLHLIYNGVDHAHFHPGVRVHRPALRASLGVPGEAPVMLFVGSGFERKGLEWALRALARLPETWLIVVGADKRMARYRRLAGRLGVAARVRFVGAQADVRPWYGAADGLWLPTRYDPFPNVVFEAMACGLGVVTSPRCGGAELIREGVQGFVRAIDDVDAMVAAVAAFSDPERARQMGVAARCAVEPFHPAVAAERLVALYRSLLDPAAASDSVIIR